MLFRFDRKNKVAIHKDAIKLCFHLKKISSDELYYIILAYDYRSKFNQWSIEERRKRACIEAFPGGKWEDVEAKIADAIEEYKSFQYDHRRATRDVYMTKKKRLENQLLSELNPRVINDIDKSIQVLEKRIEDIQHDIDASDNELELRGGKPTYIEDWQRRQVNYMKDQEVEKAREALLKSEDEGVSTI